MNAAGMIPAICVYRSRRKVRAEGQVSGRGKEEQLKCNEGVLRLSGKSHHCLTGFILTKTELQLLKASDFTAQLHKLSTVMQDSEDQNWAIIGYADRTDDAGAFCP